MTLARASAQSEDSALRAVACGSDRSADGSISTARAYGSTEAFWAETEASRATIRSAHSEPRQDELARFFPDDFDRNADSKRRG